ncbi:MAG: hypothetical protein ACP5FL_07635, partial [Thermoplasmatota archaeon]
MGRVRKMQKNSQKGRLSPQKIGKIIAVTALLIGTISISAIFIPQMTSGQGPTTLDVNIVSWDTIGIDSNNPTGEGPNCSLIQIRVSNTGSYNATNVTVAFTWTSSNTYVYLHPHESTTKNIGTIQNGKSKDVFFTICITRDKNAKGTSRAYTVSITSDNSNSTTASQTLLVTDKGLINQNQNSIINYALSDASPSVGDYVNVYINLTTSRGIERITFPVEYDPAIVEIVNFSVTYPGPADSSIIYLDNNPGSGDYNATYTFRVIGSGTADLNPYLIDKTSGVNLHYDIGLYNLDIPPIIVRYPNVTIEKTVWDGSTWAENTDARVGTEVTFNLTVRSTGTENLSYINV